MDRSVITSTWSSTTDSHGIPDTELVTLITDDVSEYR